MINPVLLRSFVCLVRTGHFTRTAEMLNMTQPGVTQHIQKLEVQVGQALISRHGKSFELTEAGERVYRYGLEREEAEQDLFASLAGDQGDVGSCRIACSGALAMQIYPALLELQAEHDGLVMELEAAPNNLTIERVKDGQSDYGLISHSVVEGDLAGELLGQDDLCLFVPRGSGFAWDDLVALGFINHPDGHHYASQLLSANYADDFTGMSGVLQSGYINQLGQILAPVAKGLGFTVLPRAVMGNGAYEGQVGVAPLEVRVKEPIYLIRKCYREMPVRFGRIRTLLMELFGGADHE